jgi:hypothetical protein
MRDALPPEICVTDLPNGVQYRLPRRQLGPVQMIGYFFLGIGLLLAGLSVFQLIEGPLLGPAQGAPAAVSLVFSACFLIPGAFGVIAGLFVVAGSSEIELRGDWLWAIERSGPLRWRRRRPTARVRRLEVQAAPVRRNGQLVTAGPLASLGALAAACDGAKPMILVLAYPVDWLRPLANDLAGRMHLADEADPAAGAAIVEVVTLPPNPGEFRERPEQPAGSRAFLEENPDGPTITIPPAGVWRAAKALLVFSVVWTGISLAVGGAFATALIRGGLRGWEAVVPLGLVTLFLGVGIAIFLAAVNMGRRRGVLAVVGDRLLVMQTGIFGGKRGEWPCDELADVRTGPSGIEVNSQPVLELQILPRDGTKLGLLAGRDRDELDWIATVLRRGLRLPRESHS